MNYSLKFATLVVVAFTKKRKETHKSKKVERAASTQPSSEYFSVRMRFILILCCLYMLDYGGLKSTTTSYMLSSMNEYDEYFKLCI